MEVFKDYNGGTVRLSFQKGSFLEKAKHVLVICRYEDSWLLTDHQERGWEFPGGKCEAGERKRQEPCLMICGLSANMR
ncbi:Putative 8-oxo-dGTP diphosphatase YtkD [Mycobacteroides abscessus subsp. abscessus]|nr:Putative 8-oxo-dGTP diphosphatase YtkD [Mycobacteroides abscessus subsp. abscessus]